MNNKKMNEQLLEQKMTNMLENNEKEHKQIMAKLDKIDQRFDGLSEAYPTRTEFNQSEKRLTALENIFKGGASVIAIALLSAIIRLILK